MQLCTQKNILSKFLKRIVHTRSKKNIRIGISEHQNGSMEKISIYDNLFTLQAIIDDNKNHRKGTYILFADVEKCFDRLWLNGACNELNKIGIPEKEVELIKKMNSKVIVAIDTPVGCTNEITLHGIVRQRAIMGPILCIVGTDEINENVERCYATYGPKT